MFINYMWNDTVIASNRINGSILPLQIDNAGENNLMNFMITPGLYKTKQSGEHFSNSIRKMQWMAK